jgi:GT2 family glycosyltransferase
MILSVVVVSYNVKFFLEQCLSSLKKAVHGSDSLNNQIEVFIIDNASEDGSLEFLAPLFPEFQFFQNKVNKGFARANNQALSLCKGEFVLFLNPDTILAEDCLSICVSFFRATPDAGALGVKMVDGAGRFLKESKRGFPGPGASFYRMSGLARLFPRSKIFSAYYMGHLHEESSHEVDVLSGAFMMVKKSVLDKTGGFDERFFMYAEDIDLSYRIYNSGFKNYYLPGTTIIHFKGESTRKDFRYIKMFYTAMELFAKKHTKVAGSSIQLFILTLGMRMHRALAYASLPFKKSEENSKKKLVFFIKGESVIQKKWTVKLTGKNIPVTKNENNGEEIIFCEGRDLSWKMIIEIISINPGRRIYSFHGSGTHAAVGSFSNNEQGEVIELYI